MDEIEKFKKHYHVLAGMKGGYLADTNDTYNTKREALQAARGAAKGAREHMEVVKLSDTFYDLDPSHVMG